MTTDYAPDEAWALTQDEADPLASYRTNFELPAEGGKSLVYFCGNSLGALPRGAMAQLDHELERWARLGVDGYFEGPDPWYTYSQRLRDPLSRLVGALPGEVIAMNALTVNLHLLLVTFYRPEGARTRILIEPAAFPSDAYAVASHAQYRGLGPEAVLIARPRPGEPLLRTEDVEGLLAERGSEIAVVWLSGVHYYTGQFLDLPRMTAAAHRAGCLVGFDLAHAIGNVELELHAWDVDFAAWCSYKYLNGGPGGIGGCFLHERHAGDRLLPRFGGWWGNDPETRFEMQSGSGFVPVADAAGWQISSPPVLAMAPLAASLALFDRVGMPVLRRKSERLTGYLEFLIDRLPGKPVRLLTPRDPAARGCQVSLQVGGAESLVRALRQRGFVTDYRNPGVIRAAPVPFYNTFHEVWRFAHALGDLVAA
ncbi:MAG: kynureninase [Gemmatimonadales bacterium]